LEFVLSAAVGFLWFSEIPGLNVIIGAVILIPSTLYIAYSENRKIKKKASVKLAKAA
jgi:S-adenosylmethionine uptake transporter